VAGDRPLARPFRGATVHRLADPATTTAAVGRAATLRATT
jgi:hypothetical protein